MDIVSLFSLCVHCKKGVLTAGIVNSFATKWGRRKMLTVLGGMGPHFWVSGLSALDVLRGVGLLWGWGIANSSVRLWFLGLVMANCHSTMALGPRLQPDDDDSIGALNFPVWTASLADSFPSPGIGNKIMARVEACQERSPRLHFYAELIMQNHNRNRTVFVVRARDYDPHHLNAVSFDGYVPLSRVGPKVSCHQSVYTSRSEAVSTSGAIDVIVITQKADSNLECSPRIRI